MLFSASPIGGQTKPKTMPQTMPATAVSIGTRRRPLKNASAAGSFVRWYRCHSRADGDADDDAAEDARVDGIGRRDLHLAGEVGVGDGRLRSRSGVA